MRFLLLLLLAACTTTVRDYDPADTADGTALLAGGLAFQGSYVAPTLRLRAVDGRRYLIRPQGDAFVVALPPGAYTIERFGNYAVKDDRPAVQAVAGETRYIGTFRAMRDEAGELRIVVADERAETARLLAARPGASEFTPGLVRSSLAPMPGVGDDHLVIAVERVRDAEYPHWSHRAGIYYSHYGDYYHYIQPRPRRSSRSRGYHRR